MNIAAANNSGSSDVFANNAASVTTNNSIFICPGNWDASQPQKKTMIARDKEKEKRECD